MSACVLLRMCKYIKTPVPGCTKIPGGEIHRHGNLVKEKMGRFGCIYSIWGSAMDASRCADEQQCFWCPCAVVFQLEDQNRQSWHHEMTSQGSLTLLREGTIIGEHNQTLGLSSGSSNTEHLALLTSHRPSTSAISVPLVEQSITRMDCDLFIHMHVPRPFWGTFSQCDFSCLMLAG